MRTFGGLRRAFHRHAPCVPGVFKTQRTVLMREYGRVGDGKLSELAGFHSRVRSCLVRSSNRVTSFAATARERASIIPLTVILLKGADLSRSRCAALYWAGVRALPLEGLPLRLAPRMSVVNLSFGSCMLLAAIESTAID